MKVAVTGASGFIGTHLLHALVSRGAEVVAIDRQPLRQEIAGVRFVALDLADAAPDSFGAIGTPDMLVHLAWGGLPNYLSLHHFEEELPRQYRFLRNMVEGGLKALLVTGTCYEYGMCDGELDESRLPMPANPYAFAKVALLEQLRFLQAKLPFALSWARLFYMWGEGQAPTSIYPLLQTAIRNGDARFPMSAGEQLRDYLPVPEVVELLASLALRAQDDGVVNICSGVPVSIRTLVERWIAESGSGIVPDLGRYPYPTYEPLAFWGSPAKRRALIGGD